MSSASHYISLPIYATTWAVIFYRITVSYYLNIQRIEIYNSFLSTFHLRVEMILGMQSFNVRKRAYAAPRVPFLDYFFRQQAGA